MKPDPIKKAYELLKCCTVCPRNCRVDRTAGKVGYCGMTDKLAISSAGPHFGEESVLVGRGGSGTIFLAGCNLLCLFCQNYDISHEKKGSVYTDQQCADMMLNLQKIGCENINFVTPTHFTPRIMKSISIARGKDLAVPIVYNCGGYESLETLRLLEGFVDIYMPDLKYMSAEISKRLSNAQDYPEVAKAALKEMHRQVGDLYVRRGVAVRGLLIRHLVMPEDFSSSFQAMDFIADEISANSYVNVMGQYRPCYRAKLVPEINRYPTASEIERVRNYARRKKLRLD